MTQFNNNFDHELGWDDEITTDAKEFVQLAPCFFCPIAPKNADSIPSVDVCKNRLCVNCASPSAVSITIVIVALLQAGNFPGFCGFGV